MRVIFAFCLLLLCSFAFAQNTIVLDKPGKRKRIHYNNGDVIYVVTKDGLRFGGRINGIGDKAFYIGEDLILIDQIVKILNYDKRKFHRSIAYKAFAGAAVTVVFSMANNLFNEQQGPVLGQAGTNVTLFFLAVGALFLPMQSKKYSIGHWRIRVLDLSPG